GDLGVLVVGGERALQRGLGVGVPARLVVGAAETALVAGFVGVELHGGLEVLDGQIELGLVGERTARPVVVGGVGFELDGGLIGVVGALVVLHVEVRTA